MPSQPVGHHVVYHVLPLLVLLHPVLVVRLGLEVEVVVVGVGLNGERPQWLLVSMLIPVTVLSRLSRLTRTTTAQVLRVNAVN